MLLLLVLAVLATFSLGSMVVWLRSISKQLSVSNRFLELIEESLAQLADHQKAD